ncbi:hypothetical protein JYT51_00705 [Candidatus Amoebophilus asiaticus]|nr:hypothetical protein [Candidatus Amoebophilus asiaticus]
MKLIKITLIATVLFCSNLTFSENYNEVEELIKKAQQLNSDLKEEEALEQYREILRIDPGNNFALWNTSLLYASIGSRFEDEDKKEEYFDKAHKYADKALEVDSNDAESHYAMSVAVGSIAEIASLFDAAAIAMVVKKHADKAIELNPNHDGAWHILGKWHYRVSNVSWLEAIAAKLLGGLPPSSNEESTNAFKKAIKLNPDEVLYYLDLAIEYEEIDEDRKAVEILKKALTLKPQSLDDPMYLKHCQELLDKF